MLENRNAKIACDNDKIRPDAFKAVKNAKISLQIQDERESIVQALREKDDLITLIASEHLQLTRQLERVE